MGGTNFDVAAAIVKDDNVGGIHDASLPDPLARPTLEPCPPRARPVLSSDLSLQLAKTRVAQLLFSFPPPLRVGIMLKVHALASVHKSCTATSAWKARLNC